MPSGIAVGLLVFAMGLALILPLRNTLCVDTTCNLKLLDRTARQPRVPPALIWLRANARFVAAVD